MAAPRSQKLAMLNRWIGITTVTCMLIANTAVIRRDVMPYWLVGDPPESGAHKLKEGEKAYTQVGIFNADGRIGWSWTESRRTTIGGIISIETTTLLERIDLPQGIATPRVRIVTKVTYREAEKHVDDLDFRIHGLFVPISLRAEAMPSGEFPFRWQIGDRAGQIILDSRAPAALGDCIRPFDRLPDLYVGRTWRLDLLDPITQILPSVESYRLGFDDVLIEVTAKEMIKQRGKQIEAYVVEGGGAKAWVEPETGRVLRQEVTLPIIGKLVLVDEPYDAKALQRAIDLVPPESDLRSEDDY